MNLIVISFIIPAIYSETYSQPEEVSVKNSNENQSFPSQQEWSQIEEPKTPMSNEILKIKPIVSAKKRRSKKKGRANLKKEPTTSYPESGSIKRKQSYMQYLMEKHIKYMQTSTTPEPVVYDLVNKVIYTREDLRKMCLQAYQTATNFGIRNATIFAENHCYLIKLYYPDVTCDQISDFLRYCDTIVLV